MHRLGLACISKLWSARRAIFRQGTAVQLGTGIRLVPQRNPLLLAKEVATLDRLSGGRVLFGIGAGWLKEETEIMGGDFEHRWAQTKDGILAMKELWTKDESEYHGKFYNFPKVRSFPKPVQKPHPPIFMGGSSKYVFQRIVEWGNGWMPVQFKPEDLRQGRQTLHELAKRAGRDPNSIEVLAFGSAGRFRTKNKIEVLEQSGVTHTTIWLDTDGDGVMKEIEELAKAVLK